MGSRKAEPASTGHDRVSHAPAAEPARAGWVAAPKREPATPAAAARTLARRVGDQRAQRILAPPDPGGAVGRGGRAKLAVNVPGDAYEREADRAADAVMRGAPAGVGGRGDGAALRRCACGGTCAACRGEEETEPLRREPDGSGGSPGFAPPVVHDVLASAGRPLEAGTRAFMERGFGVDFGGVRVHADGPAAESARAVDAHAYTVGSHVAFAEGHYAPGTAQGDRLIAHELAHVIQQSAMGASVVSGGLSRSGPAPAVQRACGPAAVGTPSGCTLPPDYGRFLVGHPSFKFGLGCDEFEPGQDTALIGFAEALPSDATLAIHGFASVDGDAGFNHHLACARASAAQSLLTSSMGGRIAASRITGVFNHGPTPGPADDRRNVVIARIEPAGSHGVFSESQSAFLQQMGIAPAQLDSAVAQRLASLLSVAADMYASAGTHDLAGTPGRSPGVEVATNAASEQIKLVMPDASLSLCWRRHPGTDTLTMRLAYQDTGGNRIEAQSVQMSSTTPNQPVVSEQSDDPTLEVLHTVLDVAGLIPVLGVVPDALNAGIYLIEGNWAEAGISAFAMIPIFGEGATLTKLGLKIERATVKKIGEEALVAELKQAKAAHKVAKEGLSPMDAMETAGGIVYVTTRIEDVEDERDPCRWDYNRCLHKEMASKPGGQPGHSRCFWCNEECGKRNGWWPSRAPKTSGSGWVRCDYEKW